MRAKKEWETKNLTLGAFGWLPFILFREGEGEEEEVDGGRTLPFAPDGRGVGGFEKDLMLSDPVARSGPAGD